jgi:hypothetical protein
VIDAARWALYPRADLGKLLECRSIHFDARREFATGGRAPDHDYANPSHATLQMVNERQDFWVPPIMGTEASSKNQSRSIIVPVQGRTC